MVRAVPRTDLGRIQTLDGVRGIAIGLVLLHHAHVLTNGAAGSVGVSLFFVLSGFLITRLLTRELSQDGSLNLPRFYARRAARLVPAFAVVALVSAAGLIATGFPGEAMRTTAGAASYIGNWLMAGGGSWLGPMSHTWSLAIEEQFYLLWPIALTIAWPFLSRHGIAVLGSLAVMATLTRPLLMLVGAPMDRISFGSDTQADGLLVGCMIALWRCPSADDGWWWLSTVGFATILTMAWLPGFGGSYLQVGQTVAVIGSAAIVIGATSKPDRLCRAVLQSRPLRHLGRISYSVYLWHYPVMWHARVVTHGAPPSPIITIFVSLALGTLSYSLVEQPIMRWRERRAPAASATGAAPLPTGSTA
jgi:peptidoglycan/LPS O-acetylase OafA/YrhL